MRVGVVLLAADSRAKPFVDDVLDEVAPEDAKAIAVNCGRTCLAALALPISRRLLIVDGAPPDVGVGALVEAVKLVDPELPILVIRHDWSGPARQFGRVRVQPGPLISSAGALAMERLLDASQP
jgi:hypothetical protein